MLLSILNKPDNKKNCILFFMHQARLLFYQSVVKKLFRKGRHELIFWVMLGYLCDSNVS